MEYLISRLRLFELRREVSSVIPTIKSKTSRFKSGRFYIE